MRRRVMLSLLSGILVVCNLNTFGVRAYDENNQKDPELTEGKVLEDESGSINGNSSVIDSNEDQKGSGSDGYANAENEVTGDAYAVLASNGDLTFFRSTSKYTNGVYTQGITDIKASCNIQTGGRT